MTHIAACTVHLDTMITKYTRIIWTGPAVVVHAILTIRFLTNSTPRVVADDPTFRSDQRADDLTQLGIENLMIQVAIASKEARPLSAVEQRNCVTGSGSGKVAAFIGRRSLGTLECRA